MRKQVKNLRHMRASRNQLTAQSRTRIVYAATVCAVGLSPLIAKAVDGTYSYGGTDNNYSDTSNWVGGVVAGGVGGTATLSTSGTILIDTNQTIGNIDLIVQSQNSLTLSSAAGASLNFATASGTPSLVTNSYFSRNDYLTSLTVAGTQGLAVTAGSNALVFQSGLNWSQFSGGVTLQSGGNGDGSMFYAQGNGSLPTTDFTFNAGYGSAYGNSKLVINGGTTQTVGALNASSSKTYISSYDTAADLTGNTPSGTNTVGLATLSIGSTNNGGTFGGSIGAGFFAGSNTADTSAAAANLAIIKTGTGSQTFGGTNFYTGGTTVNQGTLAGSLAGAFGTGNLTVNPTGTSSTSADLATVIIGPAAISPTAILTVNSNSATAVGEALFSGTTSYTIGGLSGTGNVVLATTGLTLNNSTTQTFTGNISQTGTGSLIMAGSGVTILGGTDSYTGGTSINLGTVKLSASNVLPSTGNITFASGPNTGTTGTNNILDLAGTTQTIGLLISGTTSNYAGTVTSSAAGGALTITEGTTNSNAFSGTLFSGTLALTILGSNQGGGNNVQMLDASNTFSGGLTIKSSAAVGITAANLPTAGGLGSQSTEGLRTNVAGAFGTGAITLDNGQLFIIAANNVTNPISITSRGGVLHMESTYTPTAGAFGSGFSGALSDAGGLLDINSNSGNQNVISLSGSMTSFSGTIALDTTNLGGIALSGSAIGNGNTNLLWFGNSSNGGTGRVEWNGSSNQTLTFGELNNLNSGTNSLGILQNNVGGVTATFSIGDTNASPATFAGSIINNAGTVALTKTGTNTEVLTGTLSYTGATTINGGTLTVNADASNGGVATAALSGSKSITLSGTSTLHLISALGGTGSGGGSVSLLNTLAAITISSGTPTLDLEFNGNTNPVASFTIGSTAQASGLYGSGQFFTDIGVSPNGTQTTDEAYFTAGSDGGISVTPEPASLTVLSFGGLAMLRRTRRKPGKSLQA